MNTNIFQKTQKKQHLLHIVNVRATEHVYKAQKQIDLGP